MPVSDDSERLDELESLLITAEIIADGLKRPDLNGTLMCIQDSLREIRAIQRGVVIDRSQACSPNER